LSDLILQIVIAAVLFSFSKKRICSFGPADADVCHHYRPWPGDQPFGPPMIVYLVYNAVYRGADTSSGLK